MFFRFNRPREGIALTNLREQPAVGWPRWAAGSSEGRLEVAHDVAEVQHRRGLRISLPRRRIRSRQCGDAVRGRAFLLYFRQFGLYSRQRRAHLRTEIRKTICNARARRRLFATSDVNYGRRCWARARLRRVIYHGSSRFRRAATSALTASGGSRRSNVTYLYNVH